MNAKEVLRLKFFRGGTRPNRFSEQAGKWILEEAGKIAGISAEVLDLRDYAMPFFNEPVIPSYKQEPYKNEAVARFTSKIAEGDAFIIVKQQYNRGTSGVLKNAVDWVYPEWNNKPVGFVAYGSVGGARAVEQLRLVAIELQMAPVRNAVHINSHWMLLDEKGVLKTGALDPYQKAAEGLLNQLLWWARALKSARDTQ